VTLSTFLSLLAAFTGTLSAIFFAVGTLSLSGENIRDLATTYLGVNKSIGVALSNQRAEYAVGAFMLIATFALQVASNLVPSNVQPEFLQSHLNAIGLACGILVICTLASRFWCKWLSARMNQRVTALLEDRIAVMEGRKK
jgi:hypothetical protein